MGISTALLVATSTMTVSSTTAHAETAATITSPADDVPEVPGGWQGPIEVDFTATPEGSYDVDVWCGRGYSHSYTHEVPEDGPLFSNQIPAVPANRTCEVTVRASDRSGVPLDTAGIWTTDRHFNLREVEATEKRFFPRRRDNYMDTMRVDYWLTQPARVEADVVNRQGRTVATLTAGHPFSGGNRLVWDGSTRRGTTAPAGRYRVRLTATSMNGEERSGSTSFFLADLLKVRPGAIGPARAGMTIKQAMRTGRFRRNVRYRIPGVCSVVYPLLMKEPMTWDSHIFVKSKRISEVTTHSRAVEMPKGLTARPTAAQVRRAYKGRVTSGEAGYANNALFVRRGKRWLAYLFDSYSYVRGLRPKDRTVAVSVARGRKPLGMTYDGC